MSSSAPRVANSGTATAPAAAVIVAAVMLTALITTHDPATAPHSCDPHSCDVCVECCRFVGGNATAAKCEACYESTCAFDCDDAAEACSYQCVQHCWSALGTAPCMHDCVGCRGLWLVLAVIVPYLGRFFVDFVKARVAEKLKPWLARHFDCCRPHGTGPDSARLLGGFAAGIATPDARERFTMRKLDTSNSSWAESGRRKLQQCN